MFLTDHLGLAGIQIVRGGIWVVMAAGVLLGVAAVCILRAKMKGFSPLLPLMLWYAAVLFGIVGAAFNGLWQSAGMNAVSMLTVAGSISFAISDMLLGASLLGCFTCGTAKWSIMLLYKTGILLLALAPFAPGTVWVI